MRVSLQFQRFLGYLPRILICGAGLSVLSGAVATGFHARGEAQWRNYRDEAAENGVFLSLEEPREAIPVENNLAGESPFAPVKVGADGKPLDPPTLANDLGAMVVLADLLRERRADFPAAREKLKSRNLGLPLESDREIAQAMLTAFDRQMEPRWQRVLAAEAKPDVDFRIRYWPLPMAEKLPVADFRIAEQLHGWRATAFLHLGRGTEAVGEVRGALALADAVSVDPSMIAFMVRTAILGREMDVVWEGLGTGAWSEANLAALEGMLGKVEVGLGYARAVDSERGFVNAICDALVLDPGKTSSEEVRELAGAVLPGLPFPGRRHVQAWIVRDNQLALNRHYDAVRARIDRDGDWHAVPLPMDSERMSEAQKSHYALAAVAQVNFSKSESRVLAVCARVRQARLANALERFRRVQGTFPSSLDALVPVDLPELPKDPMDGKPMRYALDGPAAVFRLWSIGDDHEDDHGVPDLEMTQMTRDLVWRGAAPAK